MDESWTLSRLTESAGSILLVIVLVTLCLMAIRRTLPGRRLRRRGEPLPHLAGGPLVHVEPRVYPAARRSRFVTVATIVFAAFAIGLPFFARASPDATALALASAIIAITFSLSNWFSGRVRLRVDNAGLHSRIMFKERTIPWTELSELRLRHVVMIGMGARMVYYCARSPTREVAFTSSMAGAAELRATIERATGLTWPAPLIDATF